MLIVDISNIIICKLTRNNNVYNYNCVYLVCQMVGKMKNNRTSDEIWTTSDETSDETGIDKDSIRLCPPVKSKLVVFLFKKKTHH